MREKMRTGDTSFVSNPGHKKRTAGAQKLEVIRVLVAEDHTVVRDGLVAIIRQEGLAYPAKVVIVLLIERLEGIYASVDE